MIFRFLINPHDIGFCDQDPVQTMHYIVVEPLCVHLYILSECIGHVIKTCVIENALSMTSQPWIQAFNLYIYIY